jgi:hypothetical protein
MASKKKLLQAAAGSAGGGAALDIPDVFSTFLYDGNHVGNSIENGINLGNDTEERVLLNLSGDTLTDTGPNTLTVSNNSVAVNTSTKKYGTGSLRFNGSATATVTDASLTLGTSDFTIEFWLYLDSLSLKGILNIGNPSDHTDYSIGVYVDANGGITSQYRNTPNNMGAFSTGTATTNMSATTWHHVAIVRHNNTLSAYLDGSVIGTDDITGTTVGWNQLELGTHWGTSGGDDYRFTGYIDDFRLSKKAVYTANFTAPSSAHSTSYTSTTGEGGLVWSKVRSNGFSNALIDTERGVNYYLKSNDTTAQDTSRTDLITSFNSNGYTLGSDGGKWYWNRSGEEYVSWTFRKAPKFFDVQTWTGNGATTQISHSLGSTPGFWLFKRTDATGQWWTGHYDGTTTRLLQLESTSDASTSPHLAWGDFPNNSTVIPPTSTYVTFSEYLNVSGASFVGYFWASHNNDGEFGPDADQDVIKCGSYTGNGSTTGPVVNLGFEPQFLMIKNASTSSDWTILDTMRGLDYSDNDPFLRPNLSNAEAAAFDCANPLATGFQLKATSVMFNTNNDTFIYIAIRRGPLAVPEDATKVFDLDINTQAINSSTPPPRTPFPVDAAIYRNRGSGSSWVLASRLTGSNAVFPNVTTAENNNYMTFDAMDGWGISQSSWEASGDFLFYNWKRAPSYFDVVTYVGNDTAGRTVSHNLGAVPEMMWIKRRNSSGGDWEVYHKDIGNTKYLILNSTAAASTNQYRWNNTTPTESVFTIGTATNVNANGDNFIAYLFATVAGVSKVGSYTGNGTGQNIDCGFSSGARFVLIKKTSNTGDWIVHDSVRGIVSGNDPFLELNTTNAENSNFDVVDPYASGFAVTTFNDWNDDGAEYIFYAIA